ncbi:hypothetical protein [Mucilaginibacter sp. UYCu711]|uniref:hypothetical protein n=1 Tax=Mucilaginibacter sp. UYCu711 TaxID=3156339 RepID=UPI003D202E4C
MNTFNELSTHEQQEFLKFPVYVSLLAANADGTTDDAEKNTAIAFDHTKTYTSNILLAGYYQKADQVFRVNWNELDASLPKGQVERKTALQAKLGKLEMLLKKFDADYQSVMHKSMQALKNHVSHAHHNILEDFLFPVPIKGLNI